MNTTSCRNFTLTRGIVFSPAAQEPDIAAYITKSLLRNYGRAANGRDEALSELKKLLQEYEKEYLGTKDESDEEYLSKFDDIE